MFDNLGTALIQAFGFFSIFGFFVYQTLFVDKKLNKSNINPSKTKFSQTNKSIKKESKKGLFNRESKPEIEDSTVKKSGLFNRKKVYIKDEIKPKKKGWFK